MNIYFANIKCVLGSMEQNYIISSIYIKTFSSYKMLFIKHSKYDSADEVIELITYATGEGSI